MISPTLFDSAYPGRGEGAVFFLLYIERDISTRTNHRGLVGNVRKKTQTDFFFSSVAALGKKVISTHSEKKCVIDLLNTNTEV